MKFMQKNGELGQVVFFLKTAAMCQHLKCLGAIQPLFVMLGELLKLKILKD